MEPWDKGDETFEILLHCSDESGERDIWRPVDKARSCFHKCTKDLMGLLAQIALVLKHHLGSPTGEIFFSKKQQFLIRPDKVARWEHVLQAYNAVARLGYSNLILVKPTGHSPLSEIE